LLARNISLPIRPFLNELVPSDEPNSTDPPCLESLSSTLERGRPADGPILSACRETAVSASAHLGASGLSWAR